MGKSTKTIGIELFVEDNRWHWRVVEWSVQGTNVTLVRGSTGDFDSSTRAARAEYAKLVMKGTR